MPVKPLQNLSRAPIIIFFADETTVGKWRQFGVHDEKTKGWYWQVAGHEPVGPAENQIQALEHALKSLKAEDE